MSPTVAFLLGIVAGTVLTRIELDVMRAMKSRLCWGRLSYIDGAEFSRQGSYLFFGWKGRFISYRR